DVDRDGAAGEAAVAGLVGETVAAGEAAVRRVGERAVAAEGEGAVANAADQHGGDRVAVAVGVVAEHAGAVYQQGGGVDGGGVAGGGRAVLAEGDGARGRRRSLHRDVVTFVGKGVRADVAGVGGIGEGAVGVEEDRTVRGGGEAGHGDRQRVVVCVGVVGQDPGGRVDVERRVHVDAVAVVDRDRRRVRAPTRLQFEHFKGGPAPVAYAGD